MSLSNAVRELRSWRLGHHPLPTVSKTEQATRSIVTAPVRPLPLPMDLDQLHAKLITAQARGEWKSITPTEWRHASACLSLGKPPLIANQAFIDAFLSAMRWYGSPVTTRRLIRYYLASYDREMAGLRRVAEYLVTHLDDCGAWEGRHREYSLFDLDAGPKQLAAAVMSSDQSPRLFLENLGFSGTLSCSGLLATAFQVACQGVRTRIEAHSPLTNSALRRLAAWASDPHRQFTFAGWPRAKGAFADTLLLPWARHTPPDAEREWITSTLLGLFKDPRLDPSAWFGISDDAQSIMRRWLTKASLEQFLTIVDNAVTDDKRHMWEARKAFWRSYYDHEFMREAWVILGKEGARYAQKLAQEGEPLGFGRLGRNQDQTQAVLIMRIGSLTIADWSHNGYCRIWHEHDQMAPEMYGPIYNRLDLSTAASFQKRHSGDWQTGVEQFIQRETGIDRNRPRR
ncbi:MAG: EH signature domain-containing protein [Magnetococcus sp. YQC-3]